MKKIHALLAAGGILITGIVVGQSIQSFPDVDPDDWFYPYVEQIKGWNVVDGNDDGTFAPGRNINRAEFAKMLTQYDKRVDEKVSSIDIPEEKDVFVPSQVMYLERYNEAPSECPEGWLESVSGRLWQEGSKSREGRTCYTDKVCQTMALNLFDIQPPECPEGWTESDNSLIWRDSWKEQYRRTCFRCSE